MAETERDVHDRSRRQRQMCKRDRLRRWPMEIDGRIARMIAPPVIREDDDQVFRSVPRLGEHTVQIKAEFAKSVGNTDE